MEPLSHVKRMTFEAIFNEKIMFPSLEELKLSDINIGIWHNQLATASFSCQNLRSLIIERCDPLKYLLSHSAAGCLGQLKRLEIIDCWSMEEIIEAEEKLKETACTKILFPRLHSLRMANLPNLRGFYFGNRIIIFGNLKEVTVNECPKFEIFSHEVLTPKFPNIKISGGTRLRAKDLNVTIQQFKEQFTTRTDKTESKGELEVEAAGASGTQGEEAVDEKAIPSVKNVEDLVLPRSDASSPATRRHERDQRPVPKIAEVIDEAKEISRLVSESGISYPTSVPEIIPAESPGTSSSHEIENEAAQKDLEVLELTENVCQSGEAASTLALSTPSNRAIVEPVSKEEAWELFHDQVGGVVDLPSIQHFAQGIVEGCCGLPWLILVTGRALADEKNVAVWEDAFNEFSLPGRDIKSRLEDQIQLLKFSFNRLKSCSLKSCFLLCALFLEDQEINTSEFIEYCIQEGLIAGSWSDAHERGHDIVEALRRALLLETTEDGLSIRMPSVMRDLALGILSSDTDGRLFLLTAYSNQLKKENRSSSTRLFIDDRHQIFSRVAAGLTEPPTEEEWEKSKMMFLMDNELSVLPDKPNCPELEMLFLQRNYQLRVVPDHFFDSMPCLTVLNLSKTRIKYLPVEISNLEKLETLILRDCERLVKLPSEVGCLKLLQVLDLRGTEIIELPAKIAELDSLSHLEVSLYGSSTSSEHARLPSQLFSRLQALETLRISVYPGDNWWHKSVKSIVKEVNNLKNLTSLSFYFPEVKFLQLFLLKSASWKEERLTEFKLIVGRDIKFNAPRVPLSVKLNYSSLSGQCLRFVNSEEIPNAIVEVLARCTAFYLDHHLNIMKLSEFGNGNINKLKICIISECPRLETVIDSKQGTEVVFPFLEHLSIHYSWNLTCIWEGVLPKGSFAALRTLSLYACPKLTYVFKSSMLQFISNLKELQVDNCEAIEKIVSSDEDITGSCCILLKSLTLHYLPELVHIGEDAQILFEYINIYDCPQLKQIFEDLELKQTLKEIKAEKDWWDRLEWKETAIRSYFEAIFEEVKE